MTRNRNDILSLVEIKRSFPEEWVAIAVRKTNADGLPSAGVVLVHDADEQFVWPALRLGESDDLIHVFHTGSRRGKGEEQGAKSEAQRAKSEEQMAKSEAQRDRTLPLALCS